MFDKKTKNRKKKTCRYVKDFLCKNQMLVTAHKVCYICFEQLDLGFSCDMAGYQYVQNIDKITIHTCKYHKQSIIIKQK